MSLTIDVFCCPREEHLTAVQMMILSYYWRAGTVVSGITLQPVVLSQFDDVRYNP